MLENEKDGLVNHNSHSQAVNSNTQNEKAVDKDIHPCDALKCNEKATEKIELSASIYGTFMIKVCKNCIGIFTKNDGEGGHEL